MSHRTLIDGTGYDITGGRTLIGGTGYDIKGGRTLVDGVGYDLNFSKSFADYTWSEIIAACASKTVPDTWAIGDQKPMTIGGTNYLIDIIGKNHDTYSSGGTAPITFQLHDSYTSMYAMHNTDVNSVGWVDCYMRTNRLQTILNQMPSEVKAAIKAVNKKTTAGNKSTSIVTTSDKLFLLAEMEVFGTDTYSSSQEGTQYEYYSLGNSRVKRVNGSASTWGLRSPWKKSTSVYVQVSASGSVDTLSANRTRGVSFAFCF